MRAPTLALSALLVACAADVTEPKEGRFDFGAAPEGFETVAPDGLYVTAGTIQPLARAVADDGSMRAVVAGGPATAVEIAFAYLGPSRKESPLANGELRRQIGLKLRAKDTCNVVYVMRQIEPTPGIFVSVKSNPGASTHAECGDRGYINLRPERGQRVVPLAMDVPHRLRADRDGDHLVVREDDAVVWEGSLPPEAFAFDGPVGVRTDNGAFEFQLRVPAGTVSVLP